MNELYNIEERYDAEEDVLYKKLFDAQEKKDKQAVQQLRAQIKELKEKFKALNKEITQEQDRRLSYTRSAKPYLDAQKVLRQAENYTHFDEIKAQYGAAKERMEALVQA